MFFFNHNGFLKIPISKKKLSQTKLLENFPILLGTFSGRNIHSKYGCGKFVFEIYSRDDVSYRGDILLLPHKLILNV